MIGKPEWFTYRKFGWGIAPKTKEGFIYIGVFILILTFISVLPTFSPITYEMVTSLIIFVVLIIVLDTIHIMFLLKKVHDERQNLHQLIIERNVSFAALFAIIVLVLYQSIIFSINATKGIIPSTFLPFDWELGVILLVMVMTKGISSFYVSKKM